jgi:F-type H+-transporting ATPase subunit delta
MKDIRVAKRYAGALFGVASRDGIIDAVTKDIEIVEQSLLNVANLRSVLLTPLVTDAEKNKVLGDAFGDRITATTLEFLKLLIRKGREGLIDESIQEFRILLADSANMIEAVATTAVPMTSAQTEQLTQSLKSLTGKNIRLTLEVDTSIIAGSIVRLGDTVIDGSVRSRFERLEQHLLGSSKLGGAI